MIKIARPTKYTVDYFPHYSTGGKTIFIIDSMYGNDGYAFWFRLLELLCNQKNLVYDVRNPVNMKFLCAKTHVNEDNALKMLNTLAELNAIDTELWSKKIIWATNLADNVQDAFKRRQNVMPKKPNIVDIKQVNADINPANDDSNPANGGNMQAENHERKEKEKVKESKVKESKGVSDAETLSLNSQAVDLCKYYEQLKPGQSIASQIDALAIMVDDYGFDWCKEALQKTVSNKGYFIKSYMEAILKNWKADGKEDDNGTVCGDSKQNNSGKEGKHIEYDFGG